MGQTASTTKDEGRASPNDSPRRERERQAPRRRESIQVLPTTRASAAPPSASLESAKGSTNSPSLGGQQLDFQSRSGASGARGHTRQRSQTSAAAGTYSTKSNDQNGGKQGRSSGDARRSGPSHWQPPQQSMPRSISPSQPMSVPSNQAAAAATAAGLDKDDTPIKNIPGHGDQTSPTGYMTPSFKRPPHLPLPIENNEVTPGSPILAAHEIEGPIGQDIDETTGLPRKGSMLSSTVDDEEISDEFKVEGQPTGPTLDTLIEWKDGGERVYMTGSFMGWNKKYRLHRNGPSKDPNAFSAIISLPAGTHHLTFLVDGQMRTSRYLPTAVDYTNVLINYIEISTDDLPRPVPSSQQAPPTKPQPIDRSSQQTQANQQQPNLPPPTPDLRPTPQSTAPSAGPSGISSPVTGSQTPTGQVAGQGQDQQSQQSQRAPQTPKQPVTPGPVIQHSTGGARKAADTKEYHNDIPQFLLDLDAPEESSRYKRATAVMGTHAPPPSLPMFLNKSILNGSMPIRDDASVLIMPNHTVLNHLATSSIKNNVLATSATTRYRKKYVTTIMYRPTKDDGD